MGWDGVRRRDTDSEAIMAGERGLSAWLPHALLYPVRGARWSVILLFAILFGFVTQVAAGPFDSSLAYSLRALPILLIALTLLQRYLFLVVEQTAMGNAVPPNLAIDGVPQRRAGLLQMIWLAVAIASTWFGSTLSMDLGWSLLATWLLALPAATLVLLMDTRSLGWLNPLRLLRTVIILGPCYLFANAAILGGAALTAAGGDIGAPYLSALLGIYGLVLGHHLVGYLAFRARAKLGLNVQFAPEVTAEREREARDRELEAALDRAHRLATVNRTRDAVEVISTGLPRAEDPVLREVMLLERLLTWRNQELLVWQARRTIGTLLDAGRASRALALMPRCLSACGDADPALPAHSLRLGQQALEEGHDDLALRILRDQDLRHPGDPAALSASLLYAETMLASGKAAAARPVLLRLSAHTEHAEAARVQRALQLIKATTQEGQ